MDSTGQLVLALRPFGGGVGATEVLILFVLNTEEFVLRDEGEVFQHFVGFCYHLRSLRLLFRITLLFSTYSRFTQHTVEKLTKVLKLGENHIIPLLIILLDEVPLPLIIELLH
jgi:hypothetical protein